MKKKPVSKVKEPECVVTLSIGTTTTQGTGSTILEALRSMPRPTKITVKSILSVTKGDKSHTRPLTVPLANRLFYPAAQIYHAKNLELLMK